MSKPLRPPHVLLIARRKALGLRQEQIAAAVGVKRAMVSHVERGRASPVVDVLARWCQVLGMDDAEVAATVAHFTIPMEETTPPPVAA